MVSYLLLIRGTTLLGSDFMIGNATLSTMLWSEVRFVAPDYIANISRLNGIQKCKVGIGFFLFFLHGATL